MSCLCNCNVMHCILSCHILPSCFLIRFVLFVNRCSLKFFSAKCPAHLCMPSASFQHCRQLFRCQLHGMQWKHADNLFLCQSVSKQCN
uniref:Uncharacterized protein n=1 Tax=Rhipicephalus appendiculatus TaxID=34631 RepID=A0A131YB42_RHIAP